MPATGKTPQPQLYRRARARVSWYPTINYDACIGDQECLHFCQNDVFVWDEENKRPVVQNPLNCVVGCDSCAQLCPVEAITFPSKEELCERLKRVRTEIKEAIAG